MMLLVYPRDPRELLFEKDISGSLLGCVKVFVPRQKCTGQGCRADELTEEIGGNDQGEQQTPSSVLAHRQLTESMPGVVLHINQMLVYR